MTPLEGLNVKYQEGPIWGSRGGVSGVKKPARKRQKLTQSSMSSIPEVKQS